MKSIQTGIFLILIGVAAAATADDDSKRVTLPPGVFYYRPAATAFGMDAAWTNPAGLSRPGMAGFELMADYYNGGYGKSWGGVVFRDGSATAFRHVDNPGGEDYDEWLAALGLSLSPTLNFGGSYRFFREGPGSYHKRHFWNLGVGTQRLGSFALAAVFSNLNRGKVEGERSAVEERYSLGYRPFGEMLTLSADMFLSSHDNLGKADFSYHAEYNPTGGLYLNGLIDSDGNFEIGIRTNLLKYLVGAQSRFDKNGHDGRTTVYVGATNMRQHSLISEPGRRLDLAVSSAPENPPRPIFGPSETPFLTLISSLYRAADDPSIAGLKLDLGRLSMGMAQAQELREALLHFRSHSKAVVCFLSTPNNLGYFVASAANTILIPPVSELQLVGLRAELTFWAGTLDKLGARIDLMRIGDYKSATETWTREASSEENKAQINRLMDDWYDQFVAGIAEGRGLSADSVRAIIDRGPFTSTEAVDCGLVDGLSYADQACRDFFQGIPNVTFRSYQSDTLINDSWKSSPVIAVVVADGEIQPDGSGSAWTDKDSGVRPTPMTRAFERVRRDSNVRGVIFRINSPGGWALAGEDIHRAVSETARVKPLIVSMANAAASGGYYIATPARMVFVDPATVTGSIGIFGGKADLSGLYEKIKLGKELYTRGKYAGMLTDTRPFTDEERTKYFSHLQAFYDHFVDLVAASRRLSADSVDALGRGRVWTGREAVACGLADRTGGIRPALDYLASELKLKRYTVAIYPQHRPWFIFPRFSLWDSVTDLLAGKDASPEAAPLFLPLSEEAVIFARIPFDLSVE